MCAFVYGINYRDKVRYGELGAQLDLVGAEVVIKPTLSPIFNIKLAERSFS